MEETISQNTDTIKKNVRSKFKEKMWCDKELEEKTKIRTNSHKLHSETGHWSILKTP